MLKIKLYNHNYNLNFENEDKLYDWFVYTFIFNNKKEFEYAIGLNMETLAFAIETMGLIEGVNKYIKWLCLGNNPQQFLDYYYDSFCERYEDLNFDI